MVICLERGADLHMAQLMPLPITVSCSSKIQIGFTFLVPAYPGFLEKRPLKMVVVVVVVLIDRCSWCNVVVAVIECIYEPYVFSQCSRCSPPSSLITAYKMTYTVSSGALNSTPTNQIQLDLWALLTDIVWHLPQVHMSVAARPHFQQDA